MNCTGEDKNEKRKGRTMGDLYPETIPRLLTQLDEVLRKSEALLIKQEQDFKEELQNFQNKCERENKEAEGKNHNVSGIIEARLKSVYQEICSIRDQVSEYRKSNFFSAAAGLLFASARRQTPSIEPIVFELEDLESCTEALYKIKTEFNRIRFGSDYGKGISGYKSSSNPKDLDIVDQAVCSFIFQYMEKEEQLYINSRMKYEQSLILQKSALRQNQYRENLQVKQRQEQERNKLWAEIRMELERLLPDEKVQMLIDQFDQSNKYRHRMNFTEKNRDGFLSRQILLHYIKWLKSEPLRAYLKEKCKKLFSERDIVLPYGIGVKGSQAWRIEADPKKPEDTQKFINTLMYDVLCGVPVGRLTYTVADPVRSGRSVTMFQNMKELIPELFGNKILSDKGEIGEQIRRLSAYVSRTWEEKLRDTDKTIFDYAEEHPEYQVQTEFLILFDFPTGIEERVLPELCNILDYGSACGVYACISCGTSSGEEYGDGQKKIMEEVRRRTLRIRQEGEYFFRGENEDLILCGKLDEEWFKQIERMYILFFEEVRHHKFVLTPAMRSLLLTKDSMEADAAAARLHQLNQLHQNFYGRLPDSKRAFQKEIVLGSLVLPDILYTGSAGQHWLQELFQTEDPKRPGNWRIGLPMLLDLKQGMHFYLECPDAVRSEVLTFTHHIIWTFLSFMPVGKVNICIFDGRQRGNSIIPFLDFRKQCPDIFDDKIYTLQEEMYEKLRALNCQIDEFIQDKLGNRYEDFFEYNQNTPSRSEPVTLLILYDFPDGMDRRNLDLLMNILQNGRRCGVYAVICRNPETAFSGYENTEHHIEEIRKYCEWIECSGGEYLIMPYRFPVYLPEMPKGAGADAFAAEYGKAMEKSRRKGLAFSDIMPKELFAAESARNLAIRVGVGDRDSVVSLVLGEGSSHHGLIAGATGSGKSTLLHTIIMSSMLNYSPDQLQLYLMDFKSGTEFKVYESVKLPHIRLLALDAMQEFGESILENLVQEMEHRAELFKEEADGVTSLQEYVRVTGRAMPRLLVIIDEFQILFNDAANRKVAEHCAELAKRIVTEGRAFGIHLLMATQSMRGISNMSLISGIVEQMLIRVGLKCGESDIRYLFSDGDSTKIQSMMKGPVGTAVMNLDYTAQQEMGFRVAYLDDDTQREYLKKISSRFSEYPCRLQVFEGKRTEKLLDYLRREGLGLTEEHPVRIHVGLPIKVAPSYTISIDKKRKHNLLICGSDAKMAARIADNYLISALLNRNVQVCCADGDLLVDDDSAREFYDLLSGWSGRFKLAEDRADIIQMIDEVYDQYQMRKKKSRKDTLFVVFKNLQFLDIVGMMLRGERVDRSEYLDEESFQSAEVPSDPLAAFDFDSFLPQQTPEADISVGEKLIQLLEKGSMYGICFVISSLEYQTVKDTMCSYGENTLRSFPERIVFSLSAADTEFLLDDVAVSGLKDNTVYFTDGVREKIRVKPYLSPEVSELREFFRENS